MRKFDIDAINSPGFSSTTPESTRMRDLPPDVLHRLRLHNQEHVLFGWETLNVEQRQSLLLQISGIDLGELQTLHGKRDQPHAHIDPATVSPIPLKPDTDPQDTSAGEAALSRGEVGVLLVAGGQGSRLGFDKPKGMFPIGPVSGKSLFQLHAEKVFALGRRYGKPIPFLIMTSSATHSDTEAYFSRTPLLRIEERAHLFLSTRRYAFC
jgi:UDP-N-acetylglucosamine/UDP-N-acetylgalactosamine diphosphorylase